MLSKSKYCAFVQCPRNLWLKTYRPELATPDNSLEARMEAGNEIGDLAMQLFGDFVEVSAHKDNGKMDLSEMISRTNELILERCPVICEASFSYNGNYCAVDILKRENGGYAIYEVKSSTHANQIYATDIAYQKYVLENCGINVTGTYLVCTNNEYVFDGTLKLDELFKIVDLSIEVAEEYRHVEGNVLAANDIMDDPVEPLYGLSENCRKPYNCAFWEHCSSHLPTPSVFDVYKIPFAKKIEYYNDGIITYEDIAGTKEMGNHIRFLQINHSLSDLGTYVDKKGVKKFLSTLSFPLYFLDFETMQLPIPKFAGTKPYAQIPFQYSLHYLESPDGELKHTEFLGISGEDPRRALAEQLWVSGYNEHDVGDLTVHIIPEQEKDDWFWIGKSLHVLEYDEYWYYAILLSSQVYGDSQAVNAITRYYSAHKIVDLHPMDLDPRYDPITNEYLLSEQINIANCIVSCYTALEEINLHVDYSLSLLNEDKTSWNPVIYLKTAGKLKSVGIDPSMEIIWLTRGDEEYIKKDNFIRNIRLCEWSGGEICDRYTTPVDALLRIKYLRNKAGAHAEAGVINSLSIYDAENAFSLCRTLLLLKFEIYHYLFKEE